MSSPNSYLPGGLLRALGTGSFAANIERHYHLDALGSVQAITGGGQSVETTYRTDAWGNIEAGSAADNPAVYCGGSGYWNDPDLGLDYVRARWLNPQTGSWLSVDPVNTEPRYRYVYNMPTMRVDPTGRDLSHPTVPPRPGTHYDWRDRVALWFHNLGRTVDDKGRHITENPATACINAANMWDHLIDIVSGTQAVEPWFHGTLDRFSRALDNFNHGIGIDKAVASADKFLSWIPGILGPVSLIAPPGLANISPLNPWFTSYAGGFVYGAYQAAVVQSFKFPGDVLRLIAYCLSKPNIVADIKKGLTAMLSGVADISHLPPYERGKAVGSMVVALIGMFLVAKGIVKLLSKLPGALSNVAVNMKALAGTARSVAGEAFQTERGVLPRVTVPQAALPAGGPIPVGPPVLHPGELPKFKVDVGSLTDQNIQSTFKRHIAEIKAKSAKTLRPRLAVYEAFEPTVDTVFAAHPTTSNIDYLIRLSKRILSRIESQYSELLELESSGGGMTGGPRTRALTALVDEELAIDGWEPIWVKSKSAAAGRTREILVTEKPLSEYEGVRGRIKGSNYGDLGYERINPETKQPEYMIVDTATTSGSRTFRGGLRPNADELSRAQQRFENSTNIQNKGAKWSVILIPKVTK